MRNIEKWAERLGVAHDMPKDRDSFYAMCPCHKDEKPTLHVYVGHKGNIFMKCPVCGAGGASVCAKLNVPTSDLAMDEPSDHEVQGPPAYDLSGYELAKVTKEALERQACKEETRGCAGMELEEILQAAADKVIARAKIASKGIEKGEHVIADVIAETAFSAFKRMVADHYSMIHCRGRLGADGKPVPDQVAMAVAKEVRKRDF